MIDQCEFGLTCLRARVHSISGVRFFAIRPSEFDWKQVTIADDTDWFVCSWNPGLPSDAIQLLPSQEVGLYMYPGAEPPVSIGRAAARVGFRGLSVAKMHLLADHWKIKFEDAKPTLEGEWALALVMFMYPEIDAATAKSYVAERFQGRESAWLRFASFINKENVHEMMQHMEPDFHADAAEVVDQAANALEAAAAKSAKARHILVKKRKRLPIGGHETDIDVLQAQAMLPDVRGCWIRKHVEAGAERWEAIALAI